MFRRVLFWMHLAAGLGAGLVVFIMSATGVALTYEKQMLAAADRRAAAIDPVPPGTPRAPLDAILERVALAVPESAVATITRRADPQAPVTVAMSGGIVVLVNPYTGHVIGEAPKPLRAAFRSITEWHRYLAGTGDYRPVGKAITGACNLAFLFLVLSGMYLWLPRRWTRAAIAAVAVPRWEHRTTKARDFNWHNALGIWSGVPLAIVVASATVISYPWASDLAYRVTGDTPPPRPAPAAPVSTARAASALSAPLRVIDLDRRWQVAETRVTDWKTVTLRMPPQPGAPLVFTIDAGYPGQPQKRATLSLDAAGMVVNWETFADQSAGRRLRSMLRFAHTGEFWGLPGQTLAGVVSAAACVLVWTGFALAWRRFRAWQSRAQDRVPLDEAA